MKGGSVLEPYCRGHRWPLSRQLVPDSAQTSSLSTNSRCVERLETSRSGVLIMNRGRSHPVQILLSLDLLRNSDNNAHRSFHLEAGHEVERYRWIMCPRCNDRSRAGSILDATGARRCAHRKSDIPGHRGGRERQCCRDLASRERWNPQSLHPNTDKHERAPVLQRGGHALTQDSGCASSNLAIAERLNHEPSTVSQIIFSERRLLS